MKMGEVTFGDAVRFARFAVLRQDVPMAVALVVTDRCQLTCRHCRVANVTRRDMPFAAVEATLRRHRANGVRALALEGGEPFLWRDGEARLEDIVLLARGLGYWRIHIYTNGLRAIDTSADMVWVSLDGRRDAYTMLRGDHFDVVVANVRAARARRVGLIFVVNRLNRHEMRPFLEWSGTLPVAGTMFYLHTPYYGRDELRLLPDERREVIDEMLGFVDERLPILNSRGALTLLRSGAWKRPSRMWWVADAMGDHACCRAASPEVCAECGYSGCVELFAAQRLDLTAIRMLVRSA
jgi:MoaA/NifB/PqqE/SkfB family radical SAM enzyme